MPILPLAGRLLINALHRGPSAASTAAAAAAATAAELTDRGCANLGDELSNDVELTVLTRLHEPPPPAFADSAAEPTAAAHPESSSSSSPSPSFLPLPVPQRRHARADSVSTVSSTASSVQARTPGDRHRRTAAHKAHKVWTEYW